MYTPTNLEISMSSLANFCNRIGIDSHLLKFIKKDDIIFNKKTADPLNDWCLFNELNNPLIDKLYFHILSDKGAENNIYPEPLQKVEHFVLAGNRHCITIDNQTYFTNIFEQKSQGSNNYRMTYPYEGIGTLVYNVQHNLRDILVKRITVSLSNRANLDLLNADNCSYSSRLTLHLTSNQRIHLSPYYITDFSDIINRKLMMLNRVLYDLWEDLIKLPKFNRFNFDLTPNIADPVKGHYLNIQDDLKVSFESFFKFKLDKHDAFLVARKFVNRYKEYNDPVAIQVMKMLPLFLDNNDSFMVENFYESIDSFNSYLLVGEMVVI